MTWHRFSRPRAADCYTILYFDANGDRRKKKGYTDKRASQELAVKLETEARKIKNGQIDPRDLAYQKHEAKPLAEHAADYGRYLAAKGSNSGHALTTTTQVSRMLELTKSRRISDLSLSKALDATVVLRSEGLSTETINHYIRSVKAFSRWLWKDGRARDHHLAHLATTSSEGDRRRVRRAMTPEEAARVVRAAERGPIFRGIEGPERGAVQLGTRNRVQSR